MTATRISARRADKTIAMITSPTSTPARSELRFLEYRLEVVSHWPPSARKDVTAEAISRRLTSIARSTLAQTGVEDLLDSTCRLLDGLFLPTPLKDS